MFFHATEKENLLYDVREREWQLKEAMDERVIEEEKALTVASENEKLKAQLERGKIFKKFEFVKPVEGKSTC